eukprot:6668511-Prymnesium_polylepis.2
MDASAARSILAKPVSARYPLSASSSRTATNRATIRSYGVCSGVQREFDSDSRTILGLEVAVDDNALATSDWRSAVFSPVCR